MNEVIVIVVKSDKEKEYGQILKNIMTEYNICEVLIYTTKQYTDNEPQIASSQKVIFIGENDVSKRNLSTIKWKFEALNMKYGWIGSVALLTVGNTLLTKKEAKDFKDMCETLKNDVKTGNISSSIKGTTLLSKFGWIFAGGIILKLVSDKQKLNKQKQEQYRYLINRFVLKDIDNYIGNTD